MFLFLLLQSLLPFTLAGGYGSPPLVQASPSPYGTPANYGGIYNTYGQAYVETVPPPPPPTILPVSPPQTYNYPIQGQNTYDTSSTVYNDQFETTTYQPPTTTTPILPPAPIIEKVDDPEKYGVPDILPSTNPSTVPISQPVPPPSNGGYAPAPLIQPAPSAYGSPTGAQPAYQEIEYTAGEVPIAVVQPGFVQTNSLNKFYPTRAIRSQRKTAETMRLLRKIA